MQKQEPSGEVPDISVRGSQGVFAGSGNQYNTWAQKPPLDPAALGGLNPHTAVARLQQLSHDELVDFFIRASPGDVSEILGVFFNADLTKLTTALADINRRKAAELIGALGDDHDLALLDDLPEAAEAIAREAAGRRWTDAGPMETFNIGYARKYKDGHIFWSANFGTRTTVGAIDNCIQDDDEQGIPWDFPAGDQEWAAISPFGTTGVRQMFQQGMVYSSKHGVYCVGEESCYENEGGSGGWLGYPVSERPSNGHFGERQIFEGGAIYSYLAEGPEGLGSFAVRPEVMSVLPNQGWHPVSKEEAVVSSSGKRQTAVHVEGEAESGISETVVYRDEKNKPVMVAPDIWEYYSGLGAEKSWLGFPVTSEYGQYLDVGRQDFEGGMIYRRPGSDPICVRKVVDEFIAQGHSIGYPVTEEHPVNSGKPDSIQFFERGVVTLRDGKYEIWTPTPPLVGYDELRVASIRSLIHTLTLEKAIQILDYEKSHAARAEVTQSLEDHIRIARLERAATEIELRLARYLPTPKD